MVMNVCIVYAVHCRLLNLLFFSIQMVCLYTKSSAYILPWIPDIRWCMYIRCYVYSVLFCRQSVEYYFNEWSSSTIFTFDLEFLSSSFDWIQKGMLSLPFRFDVYHISTITIRLRHISRVDNDNEGKRRQAQKYRHLLQRRKTIQ